MKPADGSVGTSEALAATAAATIFPGYGRLPRAPKSLPLAVLRLRCGRARCRSLGRQHWFTDKDAMGADLVTTKGNTRSRIGTFTKLDDGFNGSLKTLSLNVKCKIVPINATQDKGPDFRVLAGPLEIGAAWKRQTSANRTYLSYMDSPHKARG